MKDNFDPVKTWIRYGVSDLYFGYRNQSNNVYRYGTFFYIMAAEKHLKALLVYNKRDQYEKLHSINDKKRKVEKIVKGYSHKFKEMIDEVDSIYKHEMNETCLPSEYLGFSKENLVTAMYEGYMETRYPSVLSVSRHFPAETAKGVYHAPLGSSFFTDFMELVCKKCWYYLVTNNLSASSVITDIKEQYMGSEKFEYFESTYLSTLPIKL